MAKKKTAGAKKRPAKKTSEKPPGRGTVLVTGATSGRTPPPSR
ncbi:MAG: hypothetical protein ABIH66_11270 [bacterium]